VQFERWTGETAQGYGTCMFKPTLLIPLMFLLGVGIGCKDDEPTGAQFGEACADEGQPCAEGFRCELNYCTQVCDNDNDCEEFQGYRHECVGGGQGDGVCYIYCKEQTLECPQTLSTPLKCGVGTCEGPS